MVNLRRIQIFCDVMLCHWVVVVVVVLLLLLRARQLTLRMHYSLRLIVQP